MAPLLVIIQTLILVPVLALAGQLLVGAFNWRARAANPVYQLFAIVSRPFVDAVRLLVPRRIPDAHPPRIAFVLLVAAYLAVGFAHRDVCRADVFQSGCERWAVARGAAQ